MSRWVRWDTDLLHSPKWLLTPIEERGVFAWLLLLAAANDKQGMVTGTVEQLAVVLHVDAQTMRKALARFEEHGTLRRRKTGWAFTNFARFNPAARFLSHTQRGSGHGEPHIRNGTVRDETIREVLEELYQSRGLLRDDGDPARVARLLAEFTDRDALTEAKKAAAWTQTKPVKNFWLFFRNWLERSPRVTRDMTPEERRASLRIS